MPDTQILKIEVQAAGRADLLILEALHRETQHALISRARLKESFRTGHVMWCGRPLQPSMQLEPGVHEITLLEWNALVSSFAQPSPRGAFLPVVYEDDELLVLNKNSGTPSVPHSAAEVDTAVGAALAHLLAQGKTLEDIRTINPEKPLESGLLHRLDTGTSGLLAFAKTHESYERLARAWKQREVRKIYRAIVLGDPEPPRTVRIELAHDARSSKRMIALDDGGSTHQNVMLKRRMRGKPLPTITHLLEAHPVQLSAGAPARSAMDMTIEIETGVMHQIRCVLAYIDAPIVGDPIYGPKVSDSKQGSAHELQYTASTRLWLHAWRLELPLEGSRKLMIEAPLPPGWPAP